MAILNICGFETGDTSELATALSGTASIQTTTKRTGTYALRTNPTTIGTGFAELRGLASNGSSADFAAPTSFTRFYFRTATTPAAEEVIGKVVAGGGAKAFLTINSSRQIKAYDEVSALMATSSALALNTWYRVELKVATTGGIVELKIDGALVATGVGNTGAGDASGINLGKYVNTNGQSVDFFYDDVSISDSAYPGPGAIELMQPNENGNYTAWTGTFTDVDEVPHDADTTFISADNVFTGTEAETDALESAASAGISATINVAKPWAIVRRNVAAAEAKLRLRSGATDSDATTTYLFTGSYVLLAKLHETDPATGIAWITSGLDAAQVGLVLTAVPAGEGRCTALGMMVDFNAPPKPETVDMQAASCGV